MGESIREALHAFASDAPGGVNILANALCKPVQKLNLWRVLTGRLTLLLELVPTYGLDAPEKENSFALEQVMKFATKCFDSANGEARGVAMKVVLACVDIVGSNVRTYLPRTLKSAIKDGIEAAIDENEDPYDIRGRNSGASKSPSKSMWTASSPASTRGGVVFSPSRGRGDDWNQPSPSVPRDDISPEMNRFWGRGYFCGRFCFSLCSGCTCWRRWCRRRWGGRRNAASYLKTRGG